MFIIGIDLGNEYSQVCYYNVAKSEPESVSFQSPAADLRVPTVVLREYNNTNGRATSYRKQEKRPKKQSTNWNK